LDELKRRLEARKSESDEMIVKRLSEAKKEMAESDKFDFNIVNKNVDETVSEILKIINS